MDFRVTDCVLAVKGYADFTPVPAPDVLIESNINGYTVFPGFCDVHVHFREPGFSYKETIYSGSRAAARGGYTTVCTMPNLDPVPDSAVNLKQQLDIIRRDSCIRIIPYGAITKGEAGRELSDMESLKGLCVAFSDDGKGVQDAAMMRAAMEKAHSLDMMIVAHCEDNSLLPDSGSEWRQIERDIKLAADTGCAYHVCHISCAESVRLVREARNSGINVSCETAPHYLLLDDTFVRDDGRFKMNPPIRTAKDREALLEGVSDGTIEIIATDHAPHSRQEKSRGFSGSASGIVGIESAFQVLYTGLVLKGVISLEALVKILGINPYLRFNIPRRNDYTVWDLNAEEVVDPAAFLSKGRSTPFEGMQVRGRCMMTVADEKAAYRF